MEVIRDQDSFPDLRVNVGSLKLQNPVMTASGTFGYAREFAGLMNLHRLGGVIVKGISLEPRHGNPPPRIVETACGMLNAIGLENVGVDRFIVEKMPYLRGLGIPVIVNVLGDTIDEYRIITEKLVGVEGISAVEVNISCPNVKKGGVAFGSDPEMAKAVTRTVAERSDVPVIVKLSPNVSDVATVAAAVEDGGADGISLINTLIGMAVDLRTRTPKLANVIGGLSGPAIKPVALRMVYQVAQRVTIPVIGIGGIETAEDALEFMVAGATAIQVGTANFINPRAGEDIVEGISRFVIEEKLTSIRELIGTLRVG
ncbi:dihydroorotate dehydrogenase [Desulfopila inferna]|uniref:dihydroorotate dehydrogenase n=1 Tax=Desulfopila inferna TaxID=468528 RepID=UPI001966655A|nr:dihydroorotate dehydrogenase [Desulfopila inferna]MBM9606689.1 dihydroorotate dehydrogenase [Desulfopila inferna]